MEESSYAREMVRSPIRRKWYYFWLECNIDRSYLENKNKREDKSKNINKDNLGTQLDKKNSYVGGSSSNTMNHNHVKNRR